MLVGSGFLLLIWIALWIAAFIDALMSEADKVRVMPKAVWVILILLFSGFASIAWFIFGRPRPGTTPAGSRPSAGGGLFERLSGDRPVRARPDDSGQGWQLGGTGGQRRSGPVAPDDDPDFLRGLGKRRRDDPDDRSPDQSG